MDSHFLVEITIIYPPILTYETEFVLILVMLENSALPMIQDIRYKNLYYEFSAHIGAHIGMALV